jgi:leucyl-tRNA synthetase
MHVPFRTGWRRSDCSEQTEKRDVLQVIERKYQKLWHDNRPFESDAPSLQEYPASTSTEELHEKVPKYFATMAYPYV